MVESLTFFNTVWVGTIFSLALLAMSKDTIIWLAPVSGMQLSNRPSEGAWTGPSQSGIFTIMCLIVLIFHVLPILLTKNKLSQVSLLSSFGSRDQEWQCIGQDLGWSLRVGLRVPGTPLVPFCLMVFWIPWLLLAYSYLGRVCLYRCCVLQSWWCLLGIWSLDFEMVRLISWPIGSKTTHRWFAERKKYIFQIFVVFSILIADIIQQYT